MDALAKLRDELSRLHGPGRVLVLERLWQQLAMRYLRAGPGTPAALDHLSAAIEVLDEAYHLIDAASPARGEAAGRLGWFLTVRSAAHGTGEADREAAIPLLAEALDAANLPPGLVPVVRMSLGQSLLDRVLRGILPADTSGCVLGGPGPGARADLEEAIRQFQAILDTPPVSAEARTVTAGMRDASTALLPLVSGDLASFDMGTLLGTVTALKHLVHGGLPAGMPGSVLSAPLALPSDLTLLNPLDYPVLDLKGDPGTASIIPPRRPAAVPRLPADPPAFRRAARDRLAGLVGNGEHPVWEQARALLSAGPGQLTVGALDAFVGAATSAVEAPEDGDPVEAGLDRLLSAVGLCLREHRDGNGWVDDLAGGGYRTVAELLLAAAARIPVTHPAAAVVVEAVGALLNRARPLSGPIEGIAGPLSAYAADIASGTGTVSALGELCRAVVALTDAAELDPTRLATAVAAVPADHPWREVLGTAVGHVRLAAAVRTGEVVATGADPDGLSLLLDALLRDDIEALRAAVDTLAEATRLPQVAAVVGAGYLDLATRAPAPDRDDLTAAIRLLSRSAAGLGDSSESLRTRTWWRLAQAYRRCGASTDADRSRYAGLEALRGAGLSPLSAARFAGWMLADHRGPEAYTALEIVAAGAGRPEPATGRLVDDVCAAILGIWPRAVPPPEVPAWSEVAAAVRKVGAAALIYLHPTDDEGRTAGVLCLDPSTDSLGVLANVPVTDPLTSDDPGWSAIMDRWTGGLLIAATGDLRRIALPAVRLGDGRRLVHDVSLAHVSSGSQLLDLADRAVVPVEKAPLFVVDPRGDRAAELADVQMLRQLLYSRSVCIGAASDPADGSGSREDVLVHLRSASLVHLGCGLRGTKLQLAGEDVLDLTETGGSGLVILTEHGSEGFGSTAEALLRAGFSGIIGWQWPVPASFAALTLFMTHLILLDHRLPPMAAVTAVQQWLLDPDRELPTVLPDVHRRTMESLDLMRPALWAALAYSGC